VNCIKCNTLNIEPYLIPNVFVNYLLPLTRGGAKGFFPKKIFCMLLKDIVPFDIEKNEKHRPKFPVMIRICQLFVTIGLLSQKNLSYVT